MNDLNEKLSALGITADMINSCSIPSYEEAQELIDAGEDMFGRPQKMTPATLKAWQAMKNAAANQGIELKLVSAYRSVNYQCELIEKKVAEGRTIEDVLSSNTIPGHSEHHTGCALDLHSGETEPLAESFEKTPAFSWLSANARQFGFHLSYPRGNTQGITYEPWHWCYKV